MPDHDLPQSFESSQTRRTVGRLGAADSTAAKITHRGRASERTASPLVGDIGLKKA
jgi:hypothetical protein